MAKFLKTEKLNGPLNIVQNTPILINLDHVEYFEKRNDDASLTSVYMNGKSPFTINTSIDDIAKTIDIIEI